MAGKPVQNTYAEWTASPQAEADRTCQDCHMPDRADLWRGIRDPEMVRRAVDVELVERRGGDGLGLSLVVRNRDVGHAFPTYVTPRIFLEMWQEDASGRMLEATRIQAVIAREVNLELGTELLGTRLAPGESALLDYDLPASAVGVELVARVRVDPDFHYRAAYTQLLSELDDPGARDLIATASREIAGSEYVLTELRLPLPPPWLPGGSTRGARPTASAHPAPRG